MIGLDLAGLDWKTTMIIISLPANELYEFRVD